MAFHDDLYALAHHARTSSDPGIRAAAQRLLTGPHALIPEPARTDWATAVIYGDGEVRYFAKDDEDEAHEGVAAADRWPSADVDRVIAVSREVRVLVDGTQIIGPWQAPADQFITRNSQ